MTRFGRIIRPFLAVLFVGALFIVNSCDTNNADGPDATYAYIYQKNAAISVDTTKQPSGDGSKSTVFRFSVVQGNNIVFIYKKFIGNAGRRRMLVFQIPDSVRDFSFRDSQLKQVRALYRRKCDCAANGIAVRPAKGLIKGERLSPVSWIIKVDVIVRFPGGKARHVTFDEPFYEKDLL